MATVTIHLAPNTLLAEFYFTSCAVDLAQKHFEQYTACKPFQTLQSDLDAAEECFDLTNNPSRQQEREALYGRGRSVSVGDVVEVDGCKYLCSSSGWWEM